jgi:hypothetical protein
VSKYIDIKVNWDKLYFSWTYAMPRLICGDHKIEWVSSFKYLGYWLTTKLGWGNMIGKTRIKTRQRTAVINSFRLNGASSRQLRRVLFEAFAFPHFTWLFGIYPLFTDTQRSDLNHLYFTLLKRILKCTYWDDRIFTTLYQERTLDDRCYSYWERYLGKLAILNDGYLLSEQSEVNAHRSTWTKGELRIQCLYRSKRFVAHMDALGQALRWMQCHGTADSRMDLNEEEFCAFALFPESFEVSRLRVCLGLRSVLPEEDEDKDDESRNRSNTRLRGSMKRNVVEQKPGRKSKESYNE